MKILIVGSLNSHAGRFAPFITEQAEALQAAGCEIEYYGVTRKGVKGYLQSVPELRKVIREKKIDLVHAHFGLSGLMCCLQRIVPVVSTYHGSDINVPSVMRFSKIAMRLSAHNIFVSQRTMEIALGKDACANINHHQSAINLHKSSLVPCGINLPKAVSELPDMSYVLEPNKRHVLFAGAFDNAVKDPELAKAVVSIINKQSSISNVQLVELRGYTRDEVNSLMYACDAFLMTSKTEGSPQVVKEAMACGCPIVSTDVGDVEERVDGLDGCYVAKSREPKELAELLMQALAYGKRTNGREFVEKAGLVNELVAKKLIDIYKQVLK